MKATIREDKSKHSSFPRRRESSECHAMDPHFRGDDQVKAWDDQVKRVDDQVKCGDDLVKRGDDELMSVPFGSGCNSVQDVLESGLGRGASLPRPIRLEAAQVMHERAVPRR